MRILVAALLAAWTLGCSPQPAPTRQSEPAIWHISDADSEIWLFGSVHMLPPEVRWRGPRVDAAFAAADEFVTETDIPSDASAAAFNAFAARHGVLPEGETLSQRLSPAEAADMARAARRLGLDIDALERQRPWLAAIQLSYADLARSGQSADAGVESVLAAEAARQHKRFSSLETPEEQLSVLANLAPEDETHFLRVTLGELGQSDDMAADMDRAWARGDVATLERLFALQWREAGPAVHEAIVLKRNRAWADEIERRLQGSGRIFVAVGAAHLIGEDSVVDLLSERGIAVEGP
jgi:uncharacterized protein YbaP (TraB family)